MASVPAEIMKNAIRWEDNDRRERIFDITDSDHIVDKEVLWLKKTWLSVRGKYVGAEEAFHQTVSTRERLNVIEWP